MKSKRKQEEHLILEGFPCSVREQCKAKEVGMAWSDFADCMHQVHRARTDGRKPVRGDPRVPDAGIGPG